MSQPEYQYSQPLPPEIYRRRRIAAVVGLLVILLVLVLIVRAISGGGGSDDTAGGSSVPATAAAHSTDADVTTSGEGRDGASSRSTQKSETSTRETTSSSAEPGAQCPLDDLHIAVQSDAPTYAAGQLPDFYLTVNNPTGADCTLDLSAHPMSFEVFTLSDYARVWADTDCNDPTMSGSVDLGSGETRNFVLNGWSRTTSTPEGCTNRTDAGTGAFLLYGHLGDRTTEPQTFNLA